MVDSPVHRRQGVGVQGWGCTKSACLLTRVAVQKIFLRFFFRLPCSQFCDCTDSSTPKLMEPGALFVELAATDEPIGQVVPRDEVLTL